MAATKSHSLSIGIVGLPNSGKSTLFNSLTKCSVPAENYSFCTIDKNIGVVEIPDSKLEKLSQHYNAKKTVPAAIQFVDIAGLVKGASEGEGLGNKFLSHIREVDVILYVLRAFSSEQISHIYDRIDPVGDFEIVQTELILKDITTVERKLGEAEKLARGNVKGEDRKVILFRRLLEHLSEGNPAIEFKMSEDDGKILRELWLLSNKKRMYLLNIREGVYEPELERWIEVLRGEVMADEQVNEFYEAGQVNKFGREKQKKNSGKQDGDTQSEKRVVQQKDDFIMVADVKLVGELESLYGKEREEYIGMLDKEPVELEDIVRKAQDRLGLITFYTGNEKECNAWSIKEGATVKEAAGVIHSDLEEGFITAHVINIEKMLEVGGWVSAKDKGLIENQGKEYIVQDGDYIVVNVAGG